MRVCVLCDVLVPLEQLLGAFLFEQGKTLAEAMQLEMSLHKVLYFICTGRGQVRDEGTPSAGVMDGQIAISSSNVCVGCSR